MSKNFQQCLDNHPAPNRRFETALNQGTVTAIDLTVEQVGISARRIEYRFAKPHSSEGATNIAEQLVRRVHYLQEPLAIIESDLHGHVQVRSQKPTPQGNSRRYYEVNINPKEITVERFVASRGDRTSQEIHLTRESFERLCHDLDDIVG